MDVANMEGGLVVGTGDLSELALGWATYNGDQMSMYGVNASVPKTLVRHLVKWAAATEQDAATRATLLDIIDTPVSPELLPADDNDKIAQTPRRPPTLKPSRRTARAPASKRVRPSRSRICSTASCCPRAMKPLTCSRGTLQAATKPLWT